jgi:hypothetical protein
MAFRMVFALKVCVMYLVDFVAMFSQVMVVL